MKKTIIILLGFSLLFCLPIFLSVPFTFPRLDSDYDAILPVYQFIGNYIRVHQAVPSIIPFIGGGIPILSDPISGMLNPLLSLPLIFFDVNVSIRITIFLVTFFSGVAMFYFLKSLKVSQFLQYWGSLLYTTSGALVASIAAGHITEKFLTYPLIPLFFMIMIKPEVSFKRIVLTSLVIAGAVYSGDLYMVWFFFIFLCSIELYYFILYPSSYVKRFMSIVFTGVLFLIFSSVKLYPFFTQVLPIMKRPNITNPFLGSIHAFLLPIQFIFPFQVELYDRPFFQRHVGFYYNWYEYYGFLGLFSLIFFKNIKLVIKNNITKLFLFLIFVGSLYLASKYWYSPFHWLFIAWKSIDIFRVPQRIVVPLTSVVIGLICLVANTWERKKSLYVISLLSLVFTLGMGWYTFSYTFVPLPQTQKKFVEHVAQIDKEKLSVATFVPKTQYLLTQHNIPITNYYYGWVPKNTIEVTKDNGEILMGNLEKLHPKFILSTSNVSFNTIDYKILFQENGNTLWVMN